MLVLVAVVAASPVPAAHAVVGGTAIPIRSAPWTVFVRQTISGGFLQCTGSVLDALHVVTAAHCVFDQSGNRASITSLSIRAGISNFASATDGDAEQDRGVSSVRVPSQYSWSTSTAADDVAVLALSAPLDLSGPDVQAVALPASGVYQPHTAVALAGFGRQNVTSAPNGALYWYTGTTDDPETCGGFSNTVIPDADAVAFCVESPTSAVCTGDSGAGLVTTTGTPTLIGITSAGRPGCDTGSAGVYTYVGAPEILKFIQGNDAAPTAPRDSGGATVDVTWNGTLSVGNTLTCASSGWDGQPTLAYQFVNATTDDVLQQSAKPTYLLRASDAGSSIYCRVLATNAGGTGALRTDATGTVAGPSAVGITTVAPRSAARGRTVAVRVIVHTGPGLSGKFGVCVAPPVNVGARVCTSEVVDDGSYGGFPFTLGVRIKPSAPLGVAKLAVTAFAGVSRAASTAALRVTG
ncbi:MAG: trypsin-like serine protease [Actinobacteria bacterium]|nr:trypsin-like serine protease [Actinomycetota bacterium]